MPKIKQTKARRLLLPIAILICATSCTNQYPVLHTSEIVRVVTIHSDPAPHFDPAATLNRLYWVKSQSGKYSWVYAESASFPTGSCVEIQPHPAYRFSKLAQISDDQCSGISVDHNDPRESRFGDSDLPRIRYFRSN